MRRVVLILAVLSGLLCAGFVIAWTYITLSGPREVNLIAIPRSQVGST